MKPKLDKWFLILLCFSMATSIGGGLYEKLVVIPLWSASPPSSFAVIQPDTGVPLQNFWIPVHIAISVFVLLALFFNWKEPKVRRLLLFGLGSYIVMRVGVVYISFPRCWRFRRYLLVQLRQRNFQQEWRAGRFGLFSENLSTSFRSCVFC